MNLRRCRRAVALAWAIAATVIRFGVMRLEGPMTPLRRAFWLQQCCRHVLASIGIRYEVQGTPPHKGMVVSNHLSYLDIIVYSAAMPCVFVSKAEVDGWPYFGWAARTGGTIFLDRTSKASAASAALAMSAQMNNGVPVLLFPEGTSTDGTRVQRFHSTLFEPAIAASAPITAAAIRYNIADGTPEREACWYDDATFLSHLWKLLGMPDIRAQVSFSAANIYTDRRTAALTTHDEVALMRVHAGGHPKLSIPTTPDAIPSDETCPSPIEHSLR